MGRPSWLMSGRTSGWENKRVTVWAPEDERFRNAAWALEMLVMTCGPILMSQAPLMRVCQQGILAAGVLGVMPSKKTRSPSFAVRQRPAVPCLSLSKRLISMTSSNASKYGLGKR